MELLLIRIKSNDKETLGHLLINNKFFCYTLEDEFREEKVIHETRIAAGIYQIAFRYVGEMYKRYTARFKESHPMIWVKDVPNFEYIYIHVGNTERDTSGCILVGRNSIEYEGRFSISDSTTIYRELHKILWDIIEIKKEPVQLTVIDADRTTEEKLDFV